MGEETTAKWHKEHPDRKGIVIRPDTCHCGASNPEGHHPDYSLPLMVLWLCDKCHKKIHFNKGENK